MKFKFLLSLCVSLLIFGAASAKADIQVGTIALSPSGANGCTWAMYYYSGLNDRYYTLNCPNDTGVVNIRTLYNDCYVYSALKTGYKITGGGCNATVYKLDSAPQQPMNTQPAECTSPNKGKVYYQGPYATAQSILQTPYPQNFCGDCKVEVSATGDYAATRTIYCSTYKP